MNWFLDMCIIIFYASDANDLCSLKSKELVKNKKTSKFFICSYILKENMPKWIKRQNIIIKIATKKILNPSYELENFEEYKELFSKDRIILKKILALYSSSENKQEYYEKLIKNHARFMQRIKYFLSKLVDKEIIPVKEIDIELKSAIFTFLQNHSDALALASAIQHHQKEEMKILTGDKHDWNKNNLEWVFNSYPNLSKKYAKMPEIVFVQNL